jgi:FkbM family methyltransferase
MLSRFVHKSLNQMIPRPMRETLRAVAIGAIPSMRHLDMWTRLRSLSEAGFQPKTIYDIGASEGRWAMEAFKLWPRAKIIGFEPNASRIPSLERLAKSNRQFSFYSCFLGQTNGIVTYQDQGDQTSLYLTEGPSTVQAPMRRLDDIATDKTLPAPDFVKLDVQGAELDVLRGGKESLKNAEVVLAEVSLYPLGRDMPIVSDVLSWIGEEEFVLYDVVSMMRRESDDALLQMDFVFLRRSSSLYCESWK